MASLLRHRWLLLTALVALSLPAASAQAEIGNWSRLPITRGVRYHAVVHDAVHNRLIAFGGERNGTNTNEVYVLPLEGPPIWQMLDPTGTRPLPRNGAGVIYDSVRNRLLVHGGLSVGVRSDLWQLTLGATPAWTQLSPLGPGPGARWEHLVVYDAPRDRLLLFGGHTGTVLMNDVWALPLADPSAWQAITPTGTPPDIRWGHAGAYDAFNDQLVIHGGNDFTTPMTDTWALSLAGTPAWTNLAPGGTLPGGRWAHAGTYDSFRRRLVIFGGSNGTVTLNDVFALDLTDTPTWSPLTLAGSPPATRFGTAWIYDPPRDRLVMFGGATDGGDVDDLWNLPLSGSPAWQAGLEPSSNPVRRQHHSMALDPVSQKVWLFGGWNGSFLGDLKSLSLTGGNRWSAATAAGGPPPARHSHSLTYDPVRQRLILFGGILNSDLVFANDLWEFSLSGSPQWTLLTPAGAAPSPRASHTAVYDPPRDRILFFGGQRPSGAGNVNEVWALSLADGGSWSMLTPSGSPPEARYDHAAVYDPVRDRMLVSAGHGAVSDLSDMWSLSLAGGTAWSILPPSASLMRSGHVMIYDPEGDRLVIHNGHVSGSSQPDMYEMLLAPANPAPELLSPGGPQPVGRAAHAGVYDPAGRRLIMFGGFGANDPEVWSLPLFEGTLSAPPSANAIGVRLAAYPDPARGEVTLGFTLPVAGHAKLRVYDVSGRIVATLADGPYAAGPHLLRWDRRTSAGAEARPGLYFYELSVSGTRVAKRVVLIE